MNTDIIIGIVIGWSVGLWVGMVIMNIVNKLMRDDQNEQ